LLGQLGRFGSQLLHYFFLWLLSLRHKATLQTSTWPGQQLFGLKDAPLSGPLPWIMESREFSESTFPTHLFHGPPPHGNFWGRFHYDTAHLSPHRDWFHRLFEPVAALEGVRQAVEKLRESDRCLVGLHLRLGHGADDHARYVTPTPWNLERLRAIWPKLKRPRLYIATDIEDFPLEAYREFDPMLQQSLQVTVPGAEYYPDFHVLSQCDVLLTSNSVFSFAAAMMNKRAIAFFRPHVYRHTLEAFDPWSSMPLLHRELDKPIAWDRPKV
jgi:hypothetical protein